MKIKKYSIYVIVFLVVVFIVKYSDEILRYGNVLWDILSPLLLGVVIAYVLNIFVKKIEALPFLSNPSSKVYSGKRAISILGALFGISLLIFLLFKIIIPQLYEAFSVILKEIPDAILDTLIWVRSKEWNQPQLEEFLRNLNVNWPQIIQKVVSSVTASISTIFDSTILILTGITGLVVKFTIGLIFALYILAGKEKLQRQFEALAEVYMKESLYKKIRYILKTAHEIFQKFIIGQCTEAVIIGVLCTLGMFLLRFPYATMIGTLIGATALLPIVGAYLGAFIGAFMIFTVNPWQAVGFLVFIVVLQQLEGNLIYPKVVGSSIGLPGIWVLAAVTVGGGIGGITGMLLAVPTVATIYRILQVDVKKRKK